MLLLHLPHTSQNTTQKTHLDGGFSAKNLRISDAAQPERFPAAGGRSPSSDHSPVVFDGGKE